MSEPVIEVENLGKCFPLYTRPLDRLRELISPTRTRYAQERWALRDLSFQVHRGQNVGLLGRNGAGKSTALKLIAGKLRPTAGRVQIRGALSSILELGTGLQPALTGRQNARLNALFMGCDPWRMEAKLDEIIAFSELGEYADQPLETYSSGMQARLAFSVLVCVDPEVLILDEALATGDVHFARKGQEFLRRLCRSGCTTLIASHDMGFLAKTCDEILWIDQGRLRARGLPDDVLRDYLADEGASVSSADRPQSTLVRFSGAPGAELGVHALHWVGDDGGLLQQRYPGTDAHFAETAELCTRMGFVSEHARAGWSEIQHVDGSDTHFRVLTLSSRGQGVWGLPLPQAPTPPPAQLQLQTHNVLEAAVQVELWVGGDWVALGEVGTPGDDYPSGWGPRTFEVEALWRSNSE